MKFKKVCITYLLFFVCLTLVTGCGKKESADADKKDGNQQTASDNLSFHIKYDIKSNNPGTLDMYVNGNKIRIGINTNVDGQNVVADIYRTNDGFILVKTLSDASAYPPDKVITHDSPLRRKGRVVAIDSEYAAELMYDLATTLDRERRESAATIAALQKEIARTDAQIDALLKAAKPTVAQKQHG